MTATIVNPLAPVAGRLAPSTVAFIAANREADTASTPFARSLLAALVGGLSSVAMAESLVIASFGAPKSPSTGKPVKNVSGLRNFEGGARLYQAWKDALLVFENIDSDAYLVAPGTDEEQPDGVAGANAIRPLVTAFILSEGDVTALFGAKGLTARVKALMADHAAAIAKLNGVEPETDADADKSSDNDNAVQSLSDRAAAMLVALRDASDEAFTDAQTALSALSDYIDTRWNAIADKLQTPSDAEQPVAAAA